jgi:two-component system, response regulator PhcR
MTRSIHTRIAHHLQTILFVDDEPQATKWFAKTYARHFKIICANSVDEALLVMAGNPHIAVVMTDFRMPRQDGLALLRKLAISHPWVVKVLTTAYADKDLVLEAMNQQLVYQVLEKPWVEPKVHLVLSAALNLYQTQMSQRDLLENGVRGVHESLGFLAHELNTPLATIGAYLELLLNGKTSFDQTRLIMQRAEEQVRFSLQLVNSFVQTSKMAISHTAPARPMSVAALIRALVTEFPFQGHQRETLKLALDADFLLASQHNLVYLCLSTLLQNALRALDEHPHPQIIMTLGIDNETPLRDKYWIRVSDNAAGIAPDVLAKLLQTPVTTYEGRGGNGMGLMFCKKIMTSLSGNISIDTRYGVQHAGQTGTTITLHFPASND